MISRIFCAVFISLMLVACVPAKSYYEVESQRNKYRELYQTDSLELAKSQKINGNLLMRLIQATQDSIVLKYSYDSLYNEYNNLTLYGSQQLATIQQQLDNKSLEVNYQAQQSKQVAAALKTFNVELTSIYRRLDRSLQRYKNRGARIALRDWAVSITLPDQVAFSQDNPQELSANGKQIIHTIAATLTQHSEFSMNIMEYSRPRVERVSVDTIISYTEQHSHIHTIPARDTLSQDEDVTINYEVTKYKIDKLTEQQYTPAQLNRGSAITSFLELSENRSISSIDYMGTVVTIKRLMPNQSTQLDSGVQIVIAPKLPTVLRMIENL